MIRTARALYNFWSSFGIPAFPENNIPDEWNAEGDVFQPYITYQIIKPEWRSQISTYVRVYYRDTSFADITAKVNEIESRIGEGVMLPTEGGFLLLFKDINFCQFTPVEDTRQKEAYLSLIIEADTN